MTTPLTALIDALAKRAANDYLTAEAAQRQAAPASSTKPVPLPPATKAA